MRLASLAVIVAAMTASSAEGATVITQYFSSNFYQHNSRGAQPIGGLNLVNQVITSAVVSYDTGAYYSQNYSTFDPNETVTLAYSGNTGFDITGSGFLPVPAYVSVSFSGQLPCRNGNCFASGSAKGDYVIPQADLAYFARPNPLFISAIGGITGNVTPAVPLTARDFGITASGTITYLVADMAVPEPGTWAMMLIGSGAVGFALRRKKVRTAALLA